MISFLGIIIIMHLTTTCQIFTSTEPR